MKKAALAVIVALSLGGCAQLQALQGGLSLATKSITNPVTRQDEAKIELAIDTVIQALQVYKDACKSGAADVHCKANIAQIQAYTRQIGPLKVQLRNFVDSNDQINALVVYNQLNTLYINVKNAATSLGVKVGG